MLQKAAGNGIASKFGRNLYGCRACCYEQNTEVLRYAQNDGLYYLYTNPVETAEGAAVVTEWQVTL